MRATLSRRGSYPILIHDMQLEVLLTRTPRAYRHHSSPSTKALPCPCRRREVKFHEIRPTVRAHLLRDPYLLRFLQHACKHIVPREEDTSIIPFLLHLCDDTSYLFSFHRYYYTFWLFLDSRRLTSRKSFRSPVEAASCIK